MSVKQQRGPRRDIPTTYAAKQEQFERERAAARRRSAEAREQSAEARRTRRAARRTAPSLRVDPPVPLWPGRSRIMVVGVAADASDETKAMYL
jgi:hypothetical protein